MLLFQVEERSSLVPFRQLQVGEDLYEKEIEDLLWANLEEFTGEALFPVARKPKVSNGGIPDVVALDKNGNVLAIEVKRDVDRNQVAQCLEYAGWARTSSLDEISSLYYRGSSTFFSDWQEFTESATPIPLSKNPRLILVARDFQARTESAIEFLVENKLPVKIIRVSLYTDLKKRKFLNIEGDHIPEIQIPDSSNEGADHTKIFGRRVQISDLLDANLLQPKEELVWIRPRLDQEYTATVTSNGSLMLPDGRTFSSPSGAAMAAAEIPAYDGWYAWRQRGSSGKTLNDLRIELSFSTD